MTISEVLLTMRRKPRKNLVRRMCDECLIGQHELCDSAKCSCRCHEAEASLAA